MKAKAVILDITSYIIALAPLGVWVYINRASYFAAKTSYMSVGIFIIAIVVLCAAKDRLGQLLHSNAQLKVSIAMLFIFWALRNIADTVLVLSAFSAGGAAVAMIPAHFAKTFYKKAQMTEQAEVTGKAIANAEKEGWSGRV